MSGLSAFLATASGELGTAESPPGSNRTKYGNWYGLNGAWCGIFVSWCAHTAGVSEVVPRFSWTPAGASWYQQRGYWSRVPEVGSLAFYDVSGQGRISHVGIVESVRGDGSWVAIEGNTNAAGSRDGGSVRRQLRTTVGTSRGGFGHPRWSLVAGSAGSPGGRPVIRHGSAGGAVRAAQEALNGLLRAAGLPGIAVDGQFGPATRTAVVWFQRLRGLVADGIVGPLTWRALGL